MFVVGGSGGTYQTGRSRPEDAHGFSGFVGSKMSELKGRGISLNSLGGRRHYFNLLSKEWKDLPDVEKDALAQKQEAKRRRVEVLLPEAPSERDSLAIGVGFWNMSSKEQPFTEQAFVGTISGDLKVDQIPSATAYMAHYRAEFLKNAVF